MTEPWKHRRMTSMTAALLLLFVSGQAAARDYANSGRLTGSWGGLRDSLSDHGIEPRLHFENVLGKDLAGGKSQGRSLPFLAAAGLAVRSAGLGLWGGGTVFAGMEWRSDFWGAGSLTVDRAGAFQTMNSLDETGHYGQLAEYWYLQEFMQGRLGFKVGRQYATDLFLRQPSGREFVNSSFAAIPTVPLARYRTPDPQFAAYVSSPVRKQPAPSLGFAAWWEPGGWARLALGIFDQRPEPETPWFSNQAQAKKNVSAVLEFLVKTSLPLNRPCPGQAGLGIWYVNKTDYSGQDPATIHPHAKRFNGTGGPYVMLDQQVWKENASPADPQGLYVFGQFGFAPGKWPIILYYGGGVLYRGPIPGRDRDRTGLALAVADFSPKFEGEVNAETGVYESTFDMSGYEAVIEWIYTIQAADWLSVQHGLQYVRVPKGITDPYNRYYEKDAVVLNVRAELEF